MKKRVIVLFALGWLLSASAAFAQNVMIVNSAHPAKSATASDIRNIYLGKVSTLAGVKVVPVDQKKGSTSSEAFLASVLSMSQGEYQKAWLELMLSGEANPPTVKSSDQEVIDFVKSTPGGIGYVSAASNPTGVTILPVDGKQQW